LVNDRRDAQFFSMYLSLLLTLYMFRVHRAHHQERQIVSVQPLVAVGGRVVCRSDRELKNINKYIEKIVRHVCHLPRIIT